MSGSSYNGSVQKFAVASDASNTYAVGDVVKSAAGTDVDGVPLVVKATSGDVPLGIVVAIPPVNAGVSLVASNLDLAKTWLPLNTAGYVLVATDPHVLFEVQVDNTAVTLANSHKNSNLTITANQTSTLSGSAPFSNTVLTGSTINTTNTFVVRLLGLVQRPGNEPDSSTVAGAYTKYLAKFNTHEFVSATGFTAS
jgi:hypothetical protein